MSLRGRPPKPTPLKILDGTRKDRINFSEPQPQVVVRDPPRGMSAHGKRAWKEVLALLIPTRVMTETDYRALKLLCDWENSYEVALKILETKGTTYEQDVFHRGEVIGSVIKVRQEVQDRRDAAVELLKLYAYFGMTPTSRSKVTVPIGSGPSPLSSGARKRG